MVEEEIDFEYAWLSREQYQFRILTLVAVLADNNLAYRGTLKEMCAFFGVRTGDTRNNSKLQTAISQLENDGLIKVIKDGRTFTLTLSKKAERTSRIIKIQREWVMIAKNYSQMENKSFNVGWVPLLKVWLFLLDYNANGGTIIKDEIIANALGLSKDTVKHAREALSTDIKAILSRRRARKIDEKHFESLGSEVITLAWLPSAP